MKRVTIKDIAREAGVSTATVSLVLAGKGNIGADTRRRILSMVRTMNYIPDWNGRKLKGGRTNVIALYVFSIRGYYSLLADAICGELAKQGYELDIIVADNRESIMAGVLGKRYDGAIILHDALTEDDADLLARQEIPIVFLDRYIRGTKASCVLLDSYQTGWEAGSYLYEMGHRKVMMVEGPDTFDARRRFRGFWDYLETRGIKRDPTYCLKGGFDRGVSYAAMKDFLNQGLPLPDAIFACNDDSAYGCIKALNEKGLSVPEDVSILGCDDIELSRWFTPALATISTDFSSQGSAAARKLLELIEGGESGVVTIPGRLVERASCIRKAAR